MLKAASFISRFWTPLTLEPFASIHSAAFQQHTARICFRALSLSKCIYLLFPLLHAVCLLVLRSLGEEGQTAGLSIPIPPTTKKCAKPLCILHRSFPCFPIVSNLHFHLRSTRRRLAHFSLFISLSLHSVRSVYFTNSSCPSAGLRGFLPFVRLSLTPSALLKAPFP